MQSPSPEEQDYILIEPLSRDRASLDIEFRDEQELGEGFMCRSCRAVKPNYGAIDEVVVQGVIEDAPFGLITKGLGLARKDFLFSIGEEVVFNNFFISKVRNYRGRSLENWVAYHAINRVCVRGEGPGAKLRYCDLCGQCFYYASGKKYLYPSPPDEIEVFGDIGSSISFFMSGALAMKMEATVKLKKMRRVGFYGLPVLGEPLDGIGNF